MTVGYEGDGHLEPDSNTSIYQAQTGEVPAGEAFYVSIENRTDRVFDCSCGEMFEDRDAAAEHLIAENNYLPREGARVRISPAGSNYADAWWGTVCELKSGRHGVIMRVECTIGGDGHVEGQTYSLGADAVPWELAPEDDTETAEVTDGE